MRINGLPIFKGDARPVNLYQGPHKIAGWVEQEQTGTDMPFENTYNDRVGLSVLGRSRQDSKYYREAASAQTIAILQHAKSVLDKARVDFTAAQTVTVQGKNLFDAGSPSAVIVPGYISSGEFRVNVANTKSVIIKATAGKQYALSKVGGDRWVYGFFGSYPTVGQLVLSGGITEITGVAPTGTQYLVWYVASASSELPTQLQIEEGAMVTAYAPFVPNSPSPDYPAPISGYSGGNLYRRGKNLCPVSSKITTGTGNSGGWADNLIVKNVPVVPGQTYVVSLERSKSDNMTGMGAVPTRYVHPTPTSATKHSQLWSQYLIDYSTPPGVPFTIPAGMHYISFTFGNNVYINDGQPGLLSVENFQLELGTVATVYEPYSGSDIPLPLQAPAYGLPGAVDSRDVISGVETHRTAKLTLTGTENVMLYSDGSSSFYYITTSMAQTSESKCSHFKYGNVDGFTTVTGVLRFFATALYPTVADFKAFLSAQFAVGKAVEVVYKLATPVTYSNPTQVVPLIAGANNLFTDAGTLNVGYEVPAGQNIAGDLVSPLPDYPAAIVSSVGEAKTEGRNLFDEQTYCDASPAVYQFSAETGIFRKFTNDGRAWSAVPSFQVPANTLITVSATRIATVEVFDSLNSAIPVSGSGNERRFTSPANGLIKFKLNALDLDKNIGHVQFTRGSVAKPYTPYRPILTMPIPELRAIPDGAGGWIARDEEYLARVGNEWHLMRRQKVGHRTYTGDASEVWSVFNAGTGQQSFRVSLNGYSTAIELGILSNRWLSRRFNVAYDTPFGGICWVSSLYTSMMIVVGTRLVNDGVVDLPSWRAWLSIHPVTVDYVLAFPVETDLGPIDLPSYYPYTRVLVSGDYPPDVTATCKVVDV